MYVHSAWTEEKEEARLCHAQPAWSVGAHPSVHQAMQDTHMESTPPGGLLAQLQRAD